jgi:hypothetical protein
MFFNGKYFTIKLFYGIFRISGISDEPENRNLKLLESKKHR